MWHSHGNTLSWSTHAIYLQDECENYICKLIAASHWDYTTTNLKALSLSGIFCRVCVLDLNQFSSLTQYIGLCVCSLPLCLMVIVRIGVLYFIIKITSEVRIISHCLELGYKTTLCAVCLSIFLYEHCSVNWEPLYTVKSFTWLQCSSTGKLWRNGFIFT